MPHKAHPKTAQERHDKLDAQISKEAAKPTSDDLELSRKKREKLALKDQIAGIG